MLSLEIIAEDPTFREKIWWFFIKPIHILLAHKVLKTLRKGAERYNIKK
jgi:hypothetical protein